MSQYSELIGSFKRQGNFPLEAYYTHNSYDELVAWANEPEIKPTLHKGLLKIVADSTGQSLYWIREIKGELMFESLISNGSIEDIKNKLLELEEKLNKEIQDRKDADTAIWGTTDPSNIPDDLNSIIDLANAVIGLVKKIEEFAEYAKKIKNELKATVGTQEEDIIAYLNTLDYKSLTKVSEKLNWFFNTVNTESQGIDTWVEMSGFLDGVLDDDTLLGLLSKLFLSIMGDPTPSEPFRTLRGIEDFVRTFKSDTEHNIKNLTTELNSTQAGVGLDGDGKFSADTETTYLKTATSVMNALRILDAKVKDALVNFKLETENIDHVPLTVRKELDRTIIAAKVNLSTSNGNGVIKKNDGLFMKVSSEYSEGILSIKVNDSVVAQHVLGISSLVEDAYYDSPNETIVIVFKMMDGTNQTVRIPVSNLLREWTTDNSGPSDTVILTRTEDLGAGNDKLSADVRIYPDKYNILTKQGNTLYVKGTSDNIVHNDIKVSVVLDELSKSLTDTITNLVTANGVINDHIKDTNNPHSVTKAQVGLDKVDNTTDLEKPISVEAKRELDRKANTVDVTAILNTKAPLDSPIFTGNPQVVDRPVISDSSLAIPTTSWVKDVIKVSASDGLEQHIGDFNNPHKVTAEQTGAYNKTEVNDLLDQKADLVDGEIPTDQLPSYIQTAVHYIGQWDPVSNAPSLTPGDKTKNGEYYISTNTGIWNGISYHPGDLIVNADGNWIQIKNTSDVNSVNGQTGDVRLSIGDIPDLVGILERKAEVTSVYTIEQIDEIIENLVQGQITDLTEINNKITQINTDITNLTTNKADLVDGKVPVSQLPDSVLGGVKYQGLWNAQDNDPALSNGNVAQDGWYYIVSNAGTRFGVDFEPKDWVINSKGLWSKVDNIDSVVSVNSKKGVVILEIEDIPGLKDTIDKGGTGLDNHLQDFNNPHKVTKEQVGLGNVSNLPPNEYPISDLTRNEITRIDNLITNLATDLSNHVKDKSNPHQTTADQVGLGKVNNTTDLEKPISVAQQTELNRIDRELDKKAAQLDLNSHLQDYNNPHKTTKSQIGLDKVDNTSDLEKPISVVTQEAINNIKIEISKGVTQDQFNAHVRDKNNPHSVSKEQLGLGNVDNTADMNKPISLATQNALDKKAEVHHSHTMADIADLENLPIIKGFINSLAELPEVAVGGDKYIMITQVGSGNARYTLCEYDGATGTWKQKLLTTGGVTAVVDGDIYELASKGLKRVIDADDYKYFYDKVWNETKDLVESIEWDESVTDVIRLKITTKKSYADPGTNEATAPTIEPKISYINIEKERFISSAYSRPATQEDVDNGYASKVGVPVLVIELTTGDEVVIDLTDTLNIYDPVDTSSINMEVSDWTGNKDTSYKISAKLKIAENTDAIKIVDNLTTGVYVRLDKKNTYSIKLSDDGDLSADLVIDDAINNTSDVSLSIGAAGVSAKITWGEYD